MRLTAKQIEAIAKEYPEDVIVEVLPAGAVEVFTNPQDPNTPDGIPVLTILLDGTVRRRTI